ncbi:double zinc ribbon domain-containing protein [Sphingomonas sp. ID0503]|uniref:double zinc ribbon domain-containing protein n=1 Tax=Sphingomonas sp. ID0503 TaxID=3399691 RepID=UPI003AFA77CB
MFATPVIRAARHGVAKAVAFALPPRCAACGTIVGGDHQLCLDCWSALDFLDDGGCPVCARPADHPGQEGLHCAACLADPPPFDRLRAGVAYGEVARGIVLKLKYGRQTGLAELIARQLARSTDGLAPDTLVACVPLHRWRIWSRGFNQSALIGRRVARRHALRFVPDLLVRTRRTPPLKGLNPTQRARTVRGAFAVKPHVTVKGATILLVDDVYTTGATVRACAAILRRAGAARVEVLCWARVLRDD